MCNKTCVHGNTFSAFQHKNAIIRIVALSGLWSSVITVVRECCSCYHRRRTRKHCAYFSVCFVKKNARKL